MEKHLTSQLPRAPTSVMLQQGRGRGEKKMNDDYFFNLKPSWTSTCIY